MATKPAATAERSPQEIVIISVRVPASMREDLMRAAARETDKRGVKVSVNTLVNEFCITGLSELGKKK